MEYRYMMYYCHVNKKSVGFLTAVKSKAPFTPNDYESVAIFPIHNNSECCESTKERSGDRPESTPGAPSVASFSLLEWQQGEERRSERGEKRFL
ncbi:hypothetical protein TNCV_4399891 [Trichonephila clavipes]|nr:hypothetical protein TNCV_4399891 [Trichonephila clavipes]